MPIDEIWKIGQLFTDDYNDKLECAIKLLNAQRTNAFKSGVMKDDDFGDYTENRKEFLTEIEYFKKAGRLN